MATSNERRALWFLAIVALSGAGVRMSRGRDKPATPDAALAHQLVRVDSARSSGRRAKSPDRKTAAASPPLVVDIDFATSAELEALPGIGPGLAARIIAYRDSVGGFRSLSAFCRVPGVGQALANRLQGRVQFSGISANGGDCESGHSESARSQVTKRRKKGSKAS